MEIIKTGIEGLLILEPRIFQDARGYFFESFSQREFESVIGPVTFVQDNQSMSAKGVLRGLHFQKQYPQGKLVRVIKGSVFDVAVDLRPNSETRGKWFGVELTEENGLLLRPAAEAYDPYFSFDYDLIGKKYDAMFYPILEFTYKIPRSASQRTFVTELFLCTGGVENATGGISTTVEVHADGEWHTVRLDLSATGYWAGTIHEIRKSSQYELDDTFAKEVGGCDTFEEMYKKLGESLQAYTDQRGEMDLQDRLLKQAAETLEYTPTQEELDEAVNQQMKAFEAQLQQQGLTLEMYCNFMTTNEQELLKDMEPAALAQLRQQKAINEIVKLENLQATDEELGQATALVARQNNMTVEQLKPYMNEAFHEAIIHSVQTGKVMSLIRENATVTVV